MIIMYVLKIYQYLHYVFSTVWLFSCYLSQCRNEIHEAYVVVTSNGDMLKGEQKMNIMCVIYILRCCVWLYVLCVTDQVLSNYAR